MTTEEIMAEMDAGYELAKTDPEQKFLEDVSDNALYWAQVGGTPENVASGVTFSLLTMIDGANLATPPLDLAYVHENHELETMERGEVFNADSQHHESFYPIYREQAVKRGHRVVGNDVIISPGCVNREPIQPASESQRDRFNDAGKPQTLNSEDEFTEAVKATVAELRPQHHITDDEARVIARTSINDSIGLRDLVTNLVIRLNEPPPSVSAEATINSIFETMPEMAGLSDKQKTKIRKGFDASSKRLNKAVQSLANDIRTQMDLVAYTVEHGMAELSPTYINVVPKKRRVEEFIENCANIAEYWGENADTPAEAAEGAIGSMLNMLDGGGDIPAIDLIPAVLPELVADYNAEGTAGWPAEPINDDTDLQSTFARTLRKRRLATAESLA